MGGNGGNSEAQGVWTDSVNSQREACLVMPHCEPGDATAHDCMMVHGVSRLVAGVRYSLFAVFERKK